MSDDYPWPEDAVATLRTYWEAGMSTMQIARKMRLSKGAIVGKAHRIGLSRPSPIMRNGEAAARPAARPPVNGPTLPPLPSLAGLTFLAQPFAPLEPVRLGSRRKCAWPIGEPGKPSFRFCEAPHDTCGPYCCEHADIAFIKPPASRDQRAAG